MAIAQILSLALLFLAAVLSLLFLFNASLHRRRHRPAEKEIRPQEPLIALPQPPTTPTEVEKLVVEDVEQRGRKRRGRKNKQGSDGGKGEACRDVGKDEKTVRKDVKDVLDDCMYPFSSSASSTQRKIKLQYDQLVKSNHSKSLTMNQVGQFVNCLVESRNELQHKSDIIQRSFKIKKALLFKAERSSFDRLCQQLYKLEAEHRRLEEDAAVYNLLQEQLKLSPAYKTMLEIGTSMELKDKLDQPTDFPDISFEELLAQEKKDSFWLRNGKLRTSTS